MERTATYSTNDALEMLCALSQESRLDIFRLLVQSGPDGLPAGAIARHCNLPAPTCSFHLKELKKGGLLSCCRHGRSQVYTVNFQAMRGLLGYLTEHCCAEEDCEHETANGAQPSPSDQERGPGADRPSPAVTPNPGLRQGSAPQAASGA